MRRGPLLKCRRDTRYLRASPCSRSGTTASGKPYAAPAPEQSSTRPNLKAPGPRGLKFRCSAHVPAQPQRPNRAPGKAPPRARPWRSRSCASPAGQDSAAKRSSGLPAEPSSAVQGFPNSSEGNAGGFDDLAEDRFRLRGFLLRRREPGIDHDTMRKYRQDELLEFVRCAVVAAFQERTSLCPALQHEQSTRANAERQ